MRPVYRVQVKRRVRGWTTVKNDLPNLKDALRGARDVEPEKGIFGKPKDLEVRIQVAWNHPSYRSVEKNWHTIPPMVEDDPLFDAIFGR